MWLLVLVLVGIIVVPGGWTFYQEWTAPFEPPPVSKEEEARFRSLIARRSVPTSARSGPTSARSGPTSARSRPTSARSQPTSAPGDGDPQLRRLALGVWTDNYRGKRTMTIRPNGTATMIVELKGLDAIAGSRMRFEMRWSIENGRLKKQTVGGEPAGRVRMILKLMGDRVDEPILELTDTRLLLLDGDGKTTYDWQRVK